MMRGPASPPALRSETPQLGMIYGEIITFESSKVNEGSTKFTIFSEKNAAFSEPFYPFRHSMSRNDGSVYMDRRYDIG